MAQQPRNKRRGKEPPRKGQREHGSAQPIPDDWLDTLTAGRRIHVLIPSRWRVKECTETLTALKKRQVTDQVDYTVVCDDDDDHDAYSMIPVPHDTLVIPHESKIAACNVWPNKVFDVLAVVSDDMMPVTDGWDLFILQKMAVHFPDFGGALHLNDDVQGEKLCTIPIISRPLLSRIGNVYWPEYKSTCCDNEQMETLRSIGRLPYIDSCIIRHNHPCRGRRPTDELYKVNDALHPADAELFHRRKRAGFPGFKRQVTWSILIPTIPQRAPLLRRLLDRLWLQIDKAGVWGHVEILTELDPAKEPRGVKRNRLLERATGRYVSFIDDDDLVCDTHVLDMLEAMAENPDCVTFRGAVWRSRKRYDFDINLKYPAWRTVNGGLIERFYTHLCPVKREIALAVRFPDVDYGEDYDYSCGVRKAVRTQVHLDTDQYFYFEDWQPSPAEADDITSTAVERTDTVHPRTIGHGAGTSGQAAQTGR